MFDLLVPSFEIGQLQGRDKGKNKNYWETSHGFKESTTLSESRWRRSERGRGQMGRGVEEGGQTSIGM